ncbi:MAG: carboxypeptidase regulatory-like domain-containing protein [Bryobacteraceae bacterium]
MRRGTLILLALILSIDLWGQRVKSTLRGVVLDPSSAAIVGAEVTLMNEGTNVAQKFRTGADGTFTFPFLDPGTYRAEVAMEGFKKSVERGIVIRVATDQRLDFTLEIGRVADQIEVKAEAPLLESVSSTLGQVVDNKKITDLPISGRNVLSLLTIIPGSSGGGGGIGVSATNPSINGNRATGNNFTIDGVPVNQEFSGTTGGAGVAYVPQIDALSEFKVVTSNYSAEYGRAVGAVVAMSIKSGTNEFHGTAFEFLRNDKLDAKTFFAAPTATKPVLRYNQFGGSVGGPIRKNKLFFFTNAEWTRNIGQAVRISTVPTVRMRAGDFGEDTNTIYDPRTTRREGSAVIRDPFPNNTIPSALIDPSSKQLATFWPEPTLAGLANNYNLQTGTRSTSVRTDTKIDWVVGAKDTITGRYSDNRTDSFSGFTLPGPGNPNAQAISTSVNPGFQVSHTHTFSPVWISELRVAYQKRSNPQLPEPSSLDDWRSKLSLPALHKDTRLQWGFPNIGPTGVTAIGTPYDKFLFEQRNWNVVETMSWTRGSHFVKFGGTLSRLSTVDYIPNFPAGGYFQSGVFTSVPGRARTGRGFADFLIGWSDTSYAGLVSGGGMRPITKESALFIQDDYRVTKNLTLNLGLRWDVSTAPTTEAGVFWNFIPSCNCNRRQEPPFPTDWVNFGPRFGFAYQMRPTIVVRGGYGIGYFPQFKGLAGFGVFPPALQQNAFFSTDQVTPARTFRDTFGNFLDIGATTEVPIAINNSTGGFDPGSSKAPYIQSWNLTLEKSLAAHFVVGASYVGNKTTHMHINRDSNTLPQSLLGPNDRFGGLTAQQRRPYPNAGRVTRITNEGVSNYHSLQMRAEWRVNRGLSFLSSYTWSKAIDEPYPQLMDPTNRRSARGVSPADVRHYFAQSLSYDLPWGPGRRWLTEKNFAQYLIGGWQTNVILVARTGYPFTPLSPSNLTGSFSTGQNRPNRLHDGALPASERSINRWFDAGAFAQPEPFTFGSSPPNALYGPGMFNFDASIFKGFALMEKTTLQFRAEAFNASNTPVFALPAATIETPTVGRITGLAKGSRTIQLALKLIF